MEDIKIVPRSDMEKETETKRHVGVEVPDSLYQLIALSALSLDTSVSQIIRNALRRWMEENKLSEESLIEELISLYQDQWDKRKMSLSKDETDKDWTLFLGYCRTCMNQKNVDKDILNQVIKKIQR